jgi:hypothetical protein
MNKTLLLLSLVVFLFAQGCKKDETKGCTDPAAQNYNADATEDDGSCTFAATGPIELQGDLSTQTLSANEQYLLKGQVFIRDGVTVTIDPGTVIFGDKATKGTLIVDRGGRLIADGDQDNPIIMTSSLPAGQRDRGDWGGLIILGKANQNQPDPAIEGITPAAYFGGTDDSDNSGIYRYLRIEFAGIEITPNNETNSITMGAVGSGTLMEYCQVSFGGDDGYEWFGGALNARNLIAFGSWDDCFDVDYGFSGKVQYGLAVRYASFADQSGSNNFECDNGPNDDVTSLLTTGAFSNFTCIGPKLTSSQSASANYQHSIDLRRRTAVTIANSVFVGMPRGIRMNQNSVYENYTGGLGILTNNILCAPTTTYSGGTGTTHGAAEVETYWLTNNTTNVETDFAAVLSNLGINQNVFFGSNVSTDYSQSPTFTVTSGDLTSGASFTNPALASGFDQVSYRGAFGSTDWTTGWAEWRPVTAAY